VADGWCWFVLREKYCWLVSGGWFVLREKYCWLVADKPNDHCKYSKQPEQLRRRRSGTTENCSPTKAEQTSSHSEKRLASAHFFLLPNQNRAE
jgi:hypothetical protein